jgi:hypothetical protein
MIAAMEAYCMLAAPALDSHMSHVPMNKITIEIDPRWQKFVRSPFFYLVGAFQGVSISFAPLILYECGKGRMFAGYEGVLVPACFALIYLIPLFYFFLGGQVIKQLFKKISGLLASSVSDRGTG